MAEGPPVPAIRLTLFALSIRMDEAGEAFPSQETIAADTAIGERTVREAILEARRLCWLAVVDHLRPGKAWRRSHYIACVPDSLNLADVSLGRDVDLDRIAEQCRAQLGEASDKLHGSRRRPRADRAKPRSAKGAAAKGAAVIAAGSNPKQDIGAAAIAKKVRPPRPKGAAAIAKKVRPSSPPKSPSEYSSNKQSEGRALARETPRVKNAHDRDPEPGTQPEPPAPTANTGRAPTGAPEVLQDVLQDVGIQKPQAQPKPDLSPLIRKLINEGQTPDATQKILSGRGCTLEDVLEAIAAA